MIEHQQWQWFSERLAEFDDRLEWLRDTATVDPASLDPGVGLAELETCREELRVAEEELRAQHEELVCVLGHQDRPARNDRLLDDLPVATFASDRLGVLRSCSVSRRTGSSGAPWPSTSLRQNH